MVFPRTTEVYCWPSDGPDLASHAVPAWVKRAIHTRDVRISDGDAYLEGMRVRPGDYLLRAAGGTLLVVTPEVFAALTGVEACPPLPVEKTLSFRELPELTTEESDDRAEGIADPHNAAVEGADMPPPAPQARAWDPDDAPIPAPQPHL